MDLCLFGRWVHLSLLDCYQAGIEWVLLEIFSGVSLNSQNFVEKADYHDATPLKIPIRTHLIPAWTATDVLTNMQLIVEPHGGW